MRSPRAARGGTVGTRLEPVREPLQRLTQHKRLGGRSLSVSWDREEAPALHFKGSKPGAATPGWSPFRVGLQGESSNACSLSPPMARKGSTRSRQSADWVIAEVAERQHGVVARWQLRERGVTDARIEGRIRRGQLHPLHRAVYCRRASRRDAGGPLDGSPTGLRRESGS